MTAARAAIAAAIAGTTLLVSALVLAGHADVTDADDTRGPLDIRTVRMSANAPPAWTFTTWAPWRAVEIWDSGFFTVSYDTFGDARYDYYALIRSTGDRLQGTLHRDYRRRSDRQTRRLRVTRPDRRSVRVRVPLGAMRFAEEGVFRWHASTMWASHRCGQATCLDRAPDRGAVNEPRRPVPTPTITITPTPSP